MLIEMVSSFTRLMLRIMEYENELGVHAMNINEMTVVESNSVAVEIQ